MRSKLFIKWFARAALSMFLSISVFYLYVTLHIRLTTSGDFEREVMNHVRYPIMTGIILLLGMGLGISFFVLRRASRYLEDTLEVAKRVSQGDFSARVISTANDEFNDLVTTINRMAESLENQRGALYNEKNQLQAILDSMTEGVLVTNDRGELLLVNPALKAMLGITDNLSLGLSIIESLRYLEITESIQQVLEQKTPEHAELILRRGSDQVHLLFQVIPFEIAPGIFGTLAVFYDATEIRKLEMIRKEFVASVSHELKTPLTSIRGYAETLRSGALETPDLAKRFLEKIENNALRLQSLVNDILKLSEIESGRFELRREWVDFSGLLKTVISELADLAHSRALSLHTMISEGFPKLWVDPEAMRQILTNLLSNAIQYSSEGGKVTITADDTPDEAVIVVTDNGIGIAENDLPRIFERFYRVDKARSRSLGGTGLGLSIVKHLTQSHGGTVAVQSVLGQGSTFIVTLPK